MDSGNTFFGSIGTLFNNRIATIQKDGKLIGFRYKTSSEVKASLDAGTKRNFIASTKNKIGRLQRTLTSYSIRRDAMSIQIRVDNLIRDLFTPTYTQTFGVSPEKDEPSLRETRQKELVEKILPIVLEKLSPPEKKQWGTLIGLVQDIRDCSEELSQARSELSNLQGRKQPQVLQRPHRSSF